jgi:hypothetical protein
LRVKHAAVEADGGRMQVQRTLGAKRRRTVHPAATPSMPAAPSTAPAAPDRVLQPGSAKTYAKFDVPNPTKAGGAFEVDWERAYADAQKVLDAIDFSKRDIVIWAPGTSNHGPNKDFKAAVEDSYRGEGTNLVALEYEATWHLRRSLPTGIATMRLVLEGIRARGGDHRVLAAGESQGAWIIGEIMADPVVGGVIDRALLVGHPWLAKHQYAEGQDPRVRVINHAGDMVAMPVHGDITVGLDAMIAMRTLDLSGMGDVLKALSSNPQHGVELLKSLAHNIPIFGKLIRDPHAYGGEMTRAVEYLRHGRLPFSAEYLRLAGLAPDPTLSEPGHDDAEHRRLVASSAIAAYAAMRAA